MKEIGINIPPQLKIGKIKQEAREQIEAVPSTIQGTVDKNNSKNLDWVHEQIMVMKSKVDTAMNNATVFMNELQSISEVIYIFYQYV